MKILLQGRATVGERRGGDSTVAAVLADQFLARGHEVVVSAQPPPTLVGFDVVHAINLDRSVLTQTEQFVRAAVASGRRLVVTPLWWPLDAYVASMGAVERLAFLGRGLGVVRAVHERRFSSLPSVRRRQAAILAAANVVCPSGRAEAFALQDAFGPVPAAVVAFGTARTPPAEEGPRHGVLCVARIDPRKNQLGLIKAMRGTGVPLRLVGTPEVFPDYARPCRLAAGDDVEMAGFLPESALLQAYQEARVHALPSFFELPGLTSLDAAVSGAAVVAGRAGTAPDYFGPAASYCNTQPASIRNAVLQAYEAGPPPGLATTIAATYSWDHTAEGYLEAYRARSPGERKPT